MVTLEHPSHTQHDFSERLLSSSLTERALTNDELSSECQMLKIDKHVIQNRSMRQELIIDELEKQTVFFSHRILKSTTTFVEGKAK